MFRKILIANRGEIAVRIIRACREMGIASVAVFSEADRTALHVQLADEAVCIGPAQSKDSYLNMPNIISAACLTNANAIHPGFGFLSENSTFAEMCKECNIKFIGPEPETIDLMGNKSNARRLMSQHGVPIIPGTKENIDSAEEAVRIAKEYGYPVMLKAAAGGGGKGIRINYNDDEVLRNYAAAKGEAMVSFGNDEIYLEKAILDARHIEVQILADEHGNVVHLGERDCSLQRRNQKVLEESPSLFIDAALREKMGEYAVNAAKACGYHNAGTVEFLVDKDKNVYYMEMNTRVQVEHPVTEMVTGVDIIKEQIRIAAGEPLTLRQEEIQIRGHAIECRINAATSGTVDYLFLPSGGLGVRVDSGLYAGCKMPPFYDAMVAKVITHGSSRDEAIAKMRRALSEFVIQGIETNIDFQMDLLSNPRYLSGDYTTAFLDQNL